MRERKRLSIREIRRRVRRHLIAEADVPPGGSRSGVGQWARIGKSLATSSEVTTSEFIRWRGAMSGSEYRHEQPEKAMDRFLVDLNKAEPGDLFYLTYGLSEMQIEKQTSEQREDPTAEPIIRNSAKTFNLIKSVLMGEYSPTLEEEESDEIQVETRREVLGKSSSVFAVAKRMISSGMKTIAADQRDRIKELRTTLTKITSGEGMSRSEAIKELSEIIVLSAELQKQIASNDLNDRKLGIAAILDALHQGEAQLKPAELSREKRLVGAAQLIAFGKELLREGVRKTGIPGTGYVVETESGEKTRVFGRDTSPMGTRRVEGEVSYGVSESILDDVSDISERAQIEADNILLGACISDQRFKGLNRQIASHEIIGKMENSGLPLTVLMTTIELLLNTIRYEKFRGENGHWAQYVRGLLPATHGMTTLAWATHLEPSRTLTIAEQFLGKEQIDASSPLYEHGRGSRVLNHLDPRVDAIMRAIAQTASAIYSGRNTKPRKRNRIKGVVVDGVETDTPRVEDIVKRFNSQKGEMQPVTPQEVTDVMRIQTDARSIKDARIGTSDAAKRDYAEARKKGVNPFQVAAEVKRLAENQAETFVYENILRRLLFGVTLRCVGKRNALDMSNKAIEAASQTSSSAGSLTTRAIPIFEAMIERPKQSAINTIQNPDQLRRMVDLSIGMGGKRPSISGALESGSGKIDSPDEASVRQKSRYHRSEVRTPNLGFRLSEEDILESIRRGQDILGIISDKSNYEAGNAFQIPYIEKITTYEQNVTTDRVLRLESMYDTRLRPLRVTVQLLGAKKFHDPSMKDRQVSFAYLTPIPEMGITPVGYSAPALRDPTAEMLSIGTRSARRARAAQPEATTYKLEGFSSYDLTDRVKKDINEKHELRKQAIEAVKRLDREIARGGVNRRTWHKMSAKRALVQDLQLSHSMEQSSFETLLNSRRVAHSLESLMAEAHLIASSPAQSVSNDITTLNNMAGSGSTIDLIGSIRPPAGADRDLTHRLRVILAAVSQGIKNEVEYSRGVRQGASAPAIPAMSVVVLAALGKKNERPVKSSAQIEGRLTGALSDGELVRLPGSGGAGSGGTYPTAAPLQESINISQSAAMSLIKKLDEINIPSAISAIQGTTSHMHIDPDLEAISEDMIPVEVLETATSLRTLARIVRGNLTRSGGKEEIAVVAAANEALKRLEDFSRKVNESGFGQRSAALKKKAVVFDSESADLGSLSGSVLLEFLKLASIVLERTRNNRQSIDDIVSSVVSQSMPASGTSNRLLATQLEATARALSIIKAINDGKTTTDPLFQNLSAALRGTPLAGVVDERMDVRSEIAQRVKTRDFSSGGARASQLSVDSWFELLNSAIAEAGGALERSSKGFANFKIRDALRSGEDRIRAARGMMGLVGNESLKKEDEAKFRSIIEKMKEDEKVGFYLLSPSEYSVAKGEQWRVAQSILQDAYNEAERAFMMKPEKSTLTEVIDEEEDARDGKVTTAALLEDFEDNVMPYLRRASIEDMSGLANTLSEMVMTSSSLAETLSSITIEAARGSDPETASVIEKIKTDLGNIISLIGEIDEMALSLVNVVNQHSIRDTGVWSQIQSISMLSRMDPMDTVNGALVIADALTAPGVDGEASGIASLVASTVARAHSLGDRHRAYTNISVAAAFDTANPLMLRREYEAQEDSGGGGLTAQQSALVDSLIRGGTMDDVGSLVDEYEVARKILAYSVSNPQSGLMEEIGRLIRPSFFPGLMTGDLKQMTPAQVGALKPRKTSLAARARTIIRATAAVNRVARGFNEGGPMKSEESVRAFMALGEYLAQKMPNAISGPISAALSSPAPTSDPSRVSVGGRFMDAPEAPETVRVTRARHSTAEEQIKMWSDVVKDTTPTAIRPGGESFGGSDFPTQEYATAAQNIRALLGENEKSALKVGETPVRELTLGEAMEAVAAGEIPADAEWNSKLSGNMDVALEGLTVLLEKTQGMTPEQAEASARETLLGDVPTAIDRMLRRAKAAPSPAPTRAPAPTTAPEVEVEPEEPEEEGTASGSYSSSSGSRSLTPEALSLIDAVKRGGIPSMGITKNMVDIALANGISEDQIDNLLSMDDTTLAVKALVRLLKLKGGM